MLTRALLTSESGCSDPHGPLSAERKWEVTITQANAEPNPAAASREPRADAETLRANERSALTP
jgi:hypothetical protein